MRPIDADTLMDWIEINPLTDDGGIDINELIEHIDSMPTVREQVQLPSEQPEIIRCKDCKHYKFSYFYAFGRPEKYCDWFGFGDFDYEDFCSKAKRREKIRYRK